MATRYVRFQTGTGAVWGVLRRDKVHRLSGAPYSRHSVSKAGLLASKLTLLAPVDPPKIFAVGLNYRSHLGDRPAPLSPEIFYKPITCVTAPGSPIVIPRAATNVHFEGELVLVIGKSLKHATRGQAAAGIFGVTCGNDVSDRDWQRGPNKDLQWWRAKGSDTFGPCGPVLVRGLDHGNLMLRTRLNGEVVQEQTTADLLFDPAAIVRNISEQVTLQPGDLIFTGTPGSTRKMNPGDIVEVEIEGIGALRNPVTA